MNHVKAAPWMGRGELPASELSLRSISVLIVSGTMR